MSKEEIFLLAAAAVAVFLAFKRPQQQATFYYAGQIPAGMVWDETQGAYVSRDVDGQIIARHA